MNINLYSCMSIKESNFLPTKLPMRVRFLEGHAIQNGLNSDRRALVEPLSATNCMKMMNDDDGHCNNN